MAWVEVCIGVMRQSTAVAELALEQAGSLAVTLEDDEDHPVLEPGPGETPLWPSVRLKGLFEDNVDRARVMALLQSVPGAERPGNIRWRDVGDRDWERAWMDRFRPMRFGRHLWIVPGGMSIPHDPGNVEISLDPGLAFGTGTHPTTALCLEWLDGQELAGKTIVDYGCGSGILAIAAALKGAVRVIGVDNDPQALEATDRNAERNGVSGRVETCLPEDCPSVESGLVLANILALPLIELAPRLTGLLADGGDLVLSGILEEQCDDVLEAYRTDLAEIAVNAREGWVRVHGVKR